MDATRSLLPFYCPVGSGDYHYTYDPDKSIPLVQPKRPHKTRDQRRDDNKTRVQRRDDNKRGGV